MSIQALLAETLTCACGCGASIADPSTRVLVCEHVRAGAPAALDYPPTATSGGAQACELCVALAHTEDQTLLDLLDEGLKFFSAHCVDYHLRGNAVIA